LRLALLAWSAAFSAAGIFPGHSEDFCGVVTGNLLLLVGRKSLLGLCLITGLLGLSEGDPRCGREIARRAGEGYDNQRQRKNSNFHNITLLRKMFDMLPACRRLPESPTA